MPLEDEVLAAVVWLADVGSLDVQYLLGVITLLTAHIISFIIGALIQFKGFIQALILICIPLV